MGLWWGRKKKNSRKAKVKQKGGTMESTLLEENNNSLIDLLNDWKKEQSPALYQVPLVTDIKDISNLKDIHTNNIIPGKNLKTIPPSHGPRPSLEDQKQLLFNINDVSNFKDNNNNNSYNNNNDDLNEISYVKTDYEPKPVKIQNDLDSIIDTSTHLTTATNIISRPASKRLFIENHNNNNEISMYSENTKKYHQIIDCLDEYEDGLAQMMSEMKERPNLRGNLTTNNDDGHSIVSKSTDNSIFGTPQKLVNTSNSNTNITTYTRNINGDFGSSYSSLSLNEKSQENNKYINFEPVDSSFSELNSKRESKYTLPFIEDSLQHFNTIKKVQPGRKSQLLKDLAIPRNQRGSFNESYLLELDDFNDFNALINRNYYPNKKAINKTTFQRPSRENSPNIFSPTKNLYPENINIVKKKLDEPFIPKRTNKDLKPIVTNNWDSSNSALKKVVNIPYNYNPNKKTSPTSSHSMSSIHSSIKSNLSSPIYSPVFNKKVNKNLSSPEVNKQMEEPSFAKRRDSASSTAPSIYIFNHNKNAFKTSEGKERLRLNRASSVYMDDPVPDFKNIDLSSNPLPQIGNLLSSNLNEHYNVSANPYSETLSPVSNPYTTSNPYNNSSSNSYL